MGFNSGFKGLIDSTKNEIRQNIAVFFACDCVLRITYFFQRRKLLVSSSYNLLAGTCVDLKD